MLFFFYAGRISITLDSDWKQAEDTTNVEDVAAGERAMQVSENCKMVRIVLTTRSLMS